MLRWTWRVAFYSYAALGTDRYPPFTLGAAPDYPATLDVWYPEELSRGLVLVKWWLLALPHYVVVGFFVGGGGYAASRADDWAWGAGLGLIGVLVLFAGVALLFTTRYPRGIFDFALGLDRWVARVVAYAGLMTDRYPPFRLDQGEQEPAGARWIRRRPRRSPASPPRWNEQAVRAPDASYCSSSGASRRYSRSPLLVGGCAIVAVDRTQRDDDGFLMSPSQEFATPTYAVVSEDADIDTGGAEWALDTFLGTVRIRSESDRAVFVGIAPAVEVDRYLGGVEHDVVRRSRLDRRPGVLASCRQRHASESPSSETFWAESVAGRGEQTLGWEPKDGDWRVVLMNEDAARGVSSEMSIGAELDTTPLDRYRPPDRGRTARRRFGACDQRRRPPPRPLSAGTRIGDVAKAGALRVLRRRRHRREQFRNQPFSAKPSDGLEPSTS